MSAAEIVEAALVVLLLLAAVWVLVRRARRLRRREGLLEVSLGYTCSIVTEDGVVGGEQYDGKQRDIQAHHLTRVRIAGKGRA